MILGELSRGEIVDGSFRQLERLVRAQTDDLPLEAESQVWVMIELNI